MLPSPWLWTSHGRPAAADDSPALTLLKTGQRPDASPSPLTRREYQIAGLVASGHSNRDIAAELSISPATVARHIASILAKLALASRTQIAAWFTTNQPEARRLDQARTPLPPTADTSHGHGSPGW